MRTATFVLILMVSCQSSSHGMAMDRHNINNYNTHWITGLPARLHSELREVWRHVSNTLVSVMSVQAPDSTPDVVGASSGSSALADLTNNKGSESNSVSLPSLPKDSETSSDALPNLPTLAGQLGLNSLTADLVKAGLSDTLTERGHLTLLAPKNSAFATAPDWLKKAMENTTLLKEILQFHVITREVLFASITNEHTTRTLLGSSVRFNKYANNVVTAQCAPLDAAEVDKMASNGVLQELMEVMRPPQGTLVQVVSAGSGFQTLVSAVKAADLDELLGEEGPFTLFGPTDAAFKKLDPTTLNNLLKNKTAITDLLKYHVSMETYCSAGLVGYSNLTMLNGEQVKITVDSETVKVNDAVVIPAGVDHSATNGVMHAIDTVLMPSSLFSLLSPSQLSPE